MECPFVYNPKSCPVRQALGTLQPLEGIHEWNKYLHLLVLR